MVGAFKDGFQLVHLPDSFGQQFHPSLGDHAQPHWHHAGQPQRKMPQVVARSESQLKAATKALDHVHKRLGEMRRSLQVGCNISPARWMCDI